MSARSQDIQTYEDDLRKYIEQGDDGKLRQILRDNQIDLNQAMRNGDSLLHLATKNGQIEIVEFLLNHNASTIKKDNNGNIALHLAIESRRLIIGELLLQHQPTDQLNIQNDAGQTPQHLIVGNHAENQWNFLFQPHLRSSGSGAEVAAGNVATTSTVGLSEKLNPGYEITPNIAGAQVGKHYQLDILALLALRGSENSTAFRLATEVKDFDKFDDVVFDCGGLQVMQIKYKSTDKKIGIFSIFDEKEYDRETKKTGFDVKKYLEFYYQILEPKPQPPASSSTKTKSNRTGTDFDLTVYLKSYYSFDQDTRRIVKEVIILTNTNFARDDDRDKYFEEDPLPSDHILFINRHLVRRFKLKVSSDSNIPIVQEFIEKFRLVLNYPKIEQIEKLIRDQINIKFNKRSTELIANTFFNELQNWFRDSLTDSKPIDNKMISDIWDKLEIEEVISESEANFENLQLTKIGFTGTLEDVDEFRRDENKNTLIISTSCKQLTSARVFRHLKSCMPNDNDFIFTSSDNIVREENKFSKLIPKVFRLPNVFQILIILCEDEVNPRQLYDKFREILENSTQNPQIPQKRLIFIVDEINLEEDVDFYLTCELRNDEPSFHQFSEESKTDFMQKLLKLEGRPPVRIEEIMGRDVVAEVFDAGNLYKSLISKSELEIRSDWSFSTQTYIQRKLVALPNFSGDLEFYEPDDDDDDAFFFSESRFYTPRQSERIVVVSGDPGSGKSFLLNNIQHNINQNNNQIWAIKLNLNDFAQDDKQENHFSKIDFLETERATETETVVEFLSKMVIVQGNRKELNLRRELTRNLLVSCLKNRDVNQHLPKVVLLFDGFDEIAPKYTQKVLRFLRALNRSNIEQMWVTTRKHETHKILLGLASPIYETQLNLNDDHLVLALRSFYNIESAGGEPLKIILKNSEDASRHYEDNFIGDSEFPRIVLDNGERIQIKFFKDLDNVLGFIAIDAMTPSRNFVSIPPFSGVKLSDFQNFLDLIQTVFPTTDEVMNNNEFINFNNVSNDFSMDDQNSELENGASIIVEFENQFTSIYLSFDIIESTFRVKAIVGDAKAFTLLNLSKADQNEFVFNYCKLKKPIISSDNVEMRLRKIFHLFELIDFINHREYIDKVCQLFETEPGDFPFKESQEVSEDLDRLLLIPLFLNVLVQLTTNDQLESFADIKLHTVFEEFIALKEKIFLKEKQKLGANADESFEATVEKAQQYHAKMARSLLLDEEIEDPYIDLDKDLKMLYKFGLTAFRNGRLEFAHRNFAEYVLVFDLWKTIRNPETQQLLLEKILVEDRFEFIRSIFESYLNDKADKFASIKIPLPFEVSDQEENFLFIARAEENFNILKFLFKTLRSGHVSCYQLFQSWRPRRENFASLFVYRNPVAAKEILSNASHFNPCTLGCITNGSIFRWFDVNSSLDSTIYNFHIVSNTILDYKSIMFNNDKLGNSILHRYGTLDYVFFEERNALDTEEFKSLLLHRNFNNETLWTKPTVTLPISLKRILGSLDPSDNEFIQQILVEKFNSEGDSGLIQKEFGIRSEFSLFCQYIALSEDFLIINIYYNLFPTTGSLESILKQFEKIFSQFPENENAQGVNNLITSIISKHKAEFKVNFERLNHALKRQSFDEVEGILNDSQEFIRQIILSCDFRKEPVLKNPEITSTFLKHLEHHNYVRDFLVLRIPFNMIEFSCIESFKLIFENVWTILLSLEHSECRVFLVQYIWTSVQYNCQEILRIILNCIDGSPQVSAEDLLLYGEQIILRYDVDIHPKHEIQNETKNVLFHWFLSKVDIFQDSTIVELLAFHAEYKLDFSLSESRCEKSLFSCLESVKTIQSVTVKSITCGKMLKIILGAARFGFKTLVKKLIRWIENQNDLLFEMVDVIRYRNDYAKNALHLVARGGFLENVAQCLDDPAFRDHMNDLLEEKDLDGNTFLSEPRSWNAMHPTMIFTINKFGVDFLLSENFLNAHCREEYFIDILLFLRQHASDLETLKEQIFEVLHDAAQYQVNFTGIIDFMLINFRTEFENYLQEEAEEEFTIFNNITFNTKSCSQILHHLATICGDECRKALLTFINVNESGEFANQLKIGLENIPTLH